MSINFKVESGIQLLTRLRKKPDIENFYSVLFEKGPKYGDIIELVSEENPCILLSDMISTLILPVKFGGVDTEVLIFSTDGNFDFQIQMECLKKKLTTRGNTPELKNEMHIIESVFQKCLGKIHYIEIFDVTQFYITIQNLENILLKNSKISMVLFDTLTAFYWSEQNFKISKMDLYLKSLLKLIQKVTKDYHITVLYTRPEYFTSNKELNETSVELQNFEEINYKIRLVLKTKSNFEVIVKTQDKQIKKLFNLGDGYIIWQ